MAPNTESLLTRDLMLDAVPYSSARSFWTRGIWSFGGIMREIMLVPLPLAISRLLMSFLTFHTAMFLSASDSAFMMAVGKGLRMLKGEKEMRKREKIQRGENAQVQKMKVTLTERR
jgi:hypothetical protein